MTHEPLTATALNRLSDRELAALHERANKVTCPTCAAPPGSGCAFLPGLAYVMASYPPESISGSLAMRRRLAVDTSVLRAALHIWKDILVDPTRPNAVKTVDGKPYSLAYVRRRIAAIERELREREKSRTKGGME